MVEIKNADSNISWSIPQLLAKIRWGVDHALQQQNRYREKIKDNTVLRYSIAIVSVVLSLAVRLILGPYLGENGPFLIFIIAVMVSGWYGGFGPGIVATVLGSLATVYFLLEPLYLSGVVNARAVIHLVIFLVEGVLLSFLNEALRGANRRTLDILESITDGFIAVDPEWNFIYINAGGERLLRRRRENLIGKNMLAELAEFKSSLFFQKANQVLLTKQAKKFETFYSPRSKWLEVSVYSANNGLSIYFKDITSKKVVEQEASRNLNLLDAVIEGTSEAISVKDSHGQYLLVNSAAARMLGQDAANILTKHDHQLLPADTASLMHKIDREVVASGTAKIVEEALLVNGKPKTYLSTKAPLKDYRGRTIGIITIAGDITARKELEQRKDEFISIASHELKTPLTSIKVFIDILKTYLKKQSETTALQYVDKMEIQIAKLIKLVGELLDVSKIQAGKLELNLEAFNLYEVIKDTIETMQATATHHHIELYGAVGTTVFGDKDRIGQVLINLLSNAMKYSPTAKTIKVFVSHTNEHAKVDVQDFGIGINPEFLEKIFDRFYQVTDHTEKTYPGLGMGLYISSQIIKRHGGTLTVSSEKDQGSTFSFTLPLGT